MFFFDFHHHKKYPNGIYNLKLKESFTSAPFSVGLHPKDITENYTTDFNWVKHASQHKNCFALGECGLDGLVEVEKKLQEIIFVNHIAWANEIKKPVVVHCARRFPELFKFKKKASVPLIVHGFNKKKTIAADLLEAGFYLSFGKAVLHNVSLQQTVKDFPLDKVFLETDDTVFNLQELYHKVSELKNISVENLETQILENLERIRTI